MSSHIQQNYKDSFVKRGKRHDSEESGTEGNSGWGSVLRNVFDFSTPKATASGASSPAASGRAAAAAAAAAATAGLGGRAHAVPVDAASSYAAAADQVAAAYGPLTSGPLASTQMAAAAAATAATSPASAAPSVPLDSLTHQVLTGHSAVQDDPVAAARQLQTFLSQYRDQYGPETNSRISAAIGKLQDYIDGYKGGAGAAAAAAASGADAMGGAAAAAAAAGAGTDGAGAAGEGGVYHNYILEQLTGVLDWVNNLLVNSNPKPYVFDAYGRVLPDPAAATTLEQQQEQLRAASNSLRLLIQQLQQVNRQYAAMSDPDEKAAMGQVLSQLTTMADRLAVAATRRPVAPPMAGGGAGASAAADAVAAAASASGDLAPFVRPDAVYGAEKYRDPLLRVLDGIYHAVVVDSGLREFLSGIKQLGDSLVTSMAVTWTGAPPIGRLIAYIAAVAGVVFVMRTRLPKSLLAPTTKFLGQLGLGSSGDNPTLSIGRAAGDDGSGSGGSPGPGPGPSPGAGPTPAVPPGPAGPAPANPSAAAAFAAIAANSAGTSDGPATAAAAAAAFAAIAANGGQDSGGASSPLADLDRDWGVGDTRLPSEVLATSTNNDPYGAGRVGLETQAAAAAQRRSGGGGGGGGASGLFPSASASASIPKPPPGGWTSQYSDRADWWSFGQQPSSPSSSQPPPPPPPVDPLSDPPRPRTVAESWEAFRRINDAAATAAAPAATSFGGGGVLDTTAALAAAAVAAAAGGAYADPKMAEVARAVEERRLDKDRARLRATIKDRLRWVCLALGPVSSVVPGGEPLRDEVDGLLAQLEVLSPTDKPLNTVVDVARRTTVVPPVPLVDPLLLGDWRLVYASNASSTQGAPSAASQAAGGGPNLLAQLLHIADSLPGFGMTQVVQRLTLEDGSPAAGAAPGAPFGGSSTRFSSTSSSPYSSTTAATAASSSSRPAGAGFSPSGGPSAASSSAAGPGSGARSANIVTENSAVFRFGPLGSWRVSVRGRWVDNGGGLCATAEFESFAVRPVDLWGLPVEQLLPEVVVPVPEVLRSRSEWCTTYLDDDMRIGRGSGGALFLFRRGAGETDAAAAAAAAAAAPPPPRAPQQPPRGVGAAAAAAAAQQQPVMRPL